MICSRCGAELVPDSAAPNTSYQYENVLWIGFHGGYGMFVDNLRATMPDNTADQWERDEDGEYLSWEDGGGGVHPIPDVNYRPTYLEERTLPGPPDYEAVLCHECAHFLCDAEPWLERLLQPHGSHAHRGVYHEAHPDHYGWDYDSRRDEGN